MSAPDTDLAADLAAALDDALGPVPAGRLAPVVERLIRDYRSGSVPTAPILRSDDDAAAYAAYRMPATHAAVLDALERAAGRVPDPAVQLDLGGGTGAAVWAAAQVWPSLRRATVLEAAAPARALGRRLAGAASAPAVRTARWEAAVLGTGTELPDADLVTACYLLGELPEPVRDRLVDAAARTARTVVVVEPGTPAGYARVLAARSRLVAAGFTVAAPCPHDGTCPVTGDDWCHFAVRVNRSSRHRTLKEGTLGHEDEKFSYVVAVRGRAEQAPGRIVRHPQTRKGLVTLRVCSEDGTLREEPVPRSRKDLYRPARDAAWGDAWPPGGSDR
ncbi:small ribosomal subunit Rsm22 family protein [Pseudonocardia parietis]|uniref:Ribosomal protein RSM22 (Predicted rRNA methylase) n=1 Tax=Pseudonocardia parietis TaxID=570936 RepID=A0ABS4W284_9PSEU|nr:small ribosomal subunit Rsm22 family protein [Pseudonocardia parietis]MBP2370318.1 ribosomal protein RSM22 (predicted rRNA methylase) [Pseudonocardia parietis]